MECYNCGIVLGKEKICPSCGVDLRIYRKFVGISNFLYNQALAKAQTRDLSGAVADLRLSLQYNKVNTNARNLLGLVYYEMGEGVAAVKEWMISKGYQASENLASEYLEQTRKNPAEKDRMNQQARKFNQVLTYCRQDSIDLAVIQLKKLLNDNPKLVRGWQLMALIALSQENLEQAKKALRNAERIDNNNPLTIRYQKMLEHLEKKGAGRKQKQSQSIRDSNGNDTIIQPKLRRNTGSMGIVLNILIGLIVGAAITSFLYVPGIRKKAVSDANQAVTEANNTIADKNQTIKALEEEISSLNAKVDSESNKAKKQKEAAKSVDTLLKAYDAYINEDIELAGDYLESIDASDLSADSLSVMTTLQEKVNQQYLSVTYDAGMDAYNRYRYTEAIESLSKVVSVDENYAEGEALYCLAQAYRKSEDHEKAIETYAKVCELYPNSSLSYNAERYITELQETIENNR